MLPDTVTKFPDKTLPFISVLDTGPVYDPFPSTTRFPHNLKDPVSESRPAYFNKFILKSPPDISNTSTLCK
ncbi:hypothetical protein ATCV1_z673R [Acanthocystis turfacea chlorella virus 1]|uniref:Uncharacterized protein z673R n=1 Tax=Chlorovirus heliozoae TaxID=322019 RepID=A7K9T3_9PHYC|nr:hypothetical protein ATCV1_z673R [Acanthocystis turfacea chlorella virus 1]ABT16807.1 hypothetical protein ATCV1_z673R [Acanthocystis turfacea chlorella virus 1]